jgi:hypothetical protein
VPKRKPDLGHRTTRKILAPEDADHTWRVTQSRDLGQQGRLDVLTGNEHFERFDAGAERSFDEIFSLGDEEPELVAPAAVVQLADELELLVVAGGDQAASDANADLAFSAIAPKACGSLTARSASTLRSSSISAFFKPATNWL